MHCVLPESAHQLSPSSLMASSSWELYCLLGASKHTDTLSLSSSFNMGFRPILCAVYIVVGALAGDERWFVCTWILCVLLNKVFRKSRLICNQWANWGWWWCGEHYDIARQLGVCVFGNFVSNWFDWVRCSNSLSRDASKFARQKWSQMLATLKRNYWWHDII